MGTGQSSLLTALTLCLGAVGTDHSAHGAASTRVLKVFLADFDDVPHPETYTREYFVDLFFGRGTPRSTPEGRPIAGSVREYFLDLSDGRIDIAGEVADWVRIPRRISQIPHWKRGMKPFGESWPVIVAETLGANGITGADCRERLRLGNGETPELLVFLNTDWGTGGVNRGWGKLKEVLGRMELAELWDENWKGLPSPSSSYSATIWRKAPRSKEDGTIARTPPADELELFPLSVMMHEMGHQLAGLPDLYGPSHAPWGVFDLMAGPARTHFPMGVAAFQRVRKGWMQFTDVPRNDRAGLVLRPLESHKVAFRFPQGPGQESLVVENRACLRYPSDYSRPPTDDGPRLLVYRYDPLGRTKRMARGKTVKRITSMLRRSAHYGEVWGMPPFTAITATTKPWSRNSMGELWWEFRGMTPRPDRSILFDAHFRAVDLVSEYHTAEWRDQDGNTVSPGTYGSAGGHVTIRHADSPETPGSTAVLHCRPAPGGSMTGRYALTGRNPMRLYLVLSCFSPDSSPATLSVAAGKRRLLDALPVEPGTPSRVVLEIPAGSSDVRIELRSPAGAAASDGVYIRQGWVVEMPSTVVDLASGAPTADADPTDTDRRALPLFDGFCYGPESVVVPTEGNGDGRAIREFDLPRLPLGADLRALLGLAANTAEGAKARVSLEFVTGDDVTPAASGIELRMRAMEHGEWPERLPNAAAIVEAGVPSAVRKSDDARLRLTVERIGDRPATVVLPCLRITGD